MGKVKFQISSRATILLGRENVSKSDAAIIELIKNSYDADASFCFLYFDIIQDSLYIFDNGTGMSKDDILNKWMIIGTNNKQIDSVSKKNRVKSGEKGIGRFALDKLGKMCEMYTKTNNEHPGYYWKSNWEDFEKQGMLIGDVEAELNELDAKFIEYIPTKIVEEFEAVKNKKIEEYDEVLSNNQDLLDGMVNPSDLHLDTGTLFKITNLRDFWKDKDIDKIVEALGFLLPPREVSSFFLLIQKSVLGPVVEVTNQIDDEFDYKIAAHFKDNEFTIDLYRNEFDINKMPSNLFDRPFFHKFPYRKEDFVKEKLTFKYSIEQILTNNSAQLLKEVSELGVFDFHYIYMKGSDPKGTRFYHKKVSNRRNKWMEEFSGVKIYRDNFLVRPYGDKYSDSYDWLNLDRRRASDPQGVSDKRGGWVTDNKHSQGTILISRIQNNRIADTSNRAGIIDNANFRVLKKLIIGLISVFEKDRSYITREIELYQRDLDKREADKEDGRKLAKQVLDNKKKKQKVAKPQLPVNDQKDVKSIEVDSQNKQETLAKTVEILEEDYQEVINELKLLRSLATNGLITSTIVHDLKGVNSVLVNRVHSFKLALEMNDQYLLDRNLNDLRNTDTLIKSWMKIITEQTTSDRRNKQVLDITVVISNLINLMQSIMLPKLIDLSFNVIGENFVLNIFESDFESIFYNLIMNSIEAFEISYKSKRIIVIEIESLDGSIKMVYRDNGDGISSIFKTPEQVFEFGKSSKLDKEGNQIGTGLGMYIVASALDDYKAEYKITKYLDGFELEMIIPR